MPIIDIFEAKGLVRKLDATAGPDEVRTCVHIKTKEGFYTLWEVVLTCR